MREFILNDGTRYVWLEDGWYKNGDLANGPLCTTNGRSTKIVGLSQMYVLYEGGVFHPEAIEELYPLH